MYNSKIKIKRILTLFILPAVLIVLLFVLLFLSEKGLFLGNRNILSGSGTKKDPYIIKNEEDYLSFAATLTNGSSPYIYSYIMLDADLDFAGMEADIPYSTDGVMFFGVFEGNGHTIKGLSLQKEGEPCGLFPDLSGTVCNIRVTDCEFTGKVVGGICGLLRGTGKIYNCYSEAALKGEKCAGGIAGDNYGRIENCVSKEPAAGVEEKESYCINCFDRAADNAVLNAYIPRILENQGIYSWREDLSFGEYVNTIDTLELVFAKGSFPQSIGAFYSIPERKFIFTLPEKKRKTTYTMRALLTDGSSETFTAGDEGTIVLSNGNAYEYQIFYTEDVNSFFINFDANDSIKYLSYLKTNELVGTLVVTDESGNVTLKKAGLSLSGRGNDSFRTDKPGYNMELESAAAVAGMAADEKFCLLPGYRDDCMFSYIYTRDLFKKLGFEYAPEYKLVNLYINGKYQGIYFFTENIDISEAAFDLVNMNKETRNKNRKPLYTYPQIEEGGSRREAKRVYYDLPVESDDVTGGYIVAINYNDYLNKRSRFRTNRNMLITIKSDQFLGKQQIDYIQDRWQRYEDAVLNPEGYNERGEYYADLIDMECFADQWLFYELVMEQSMDDSIYYYKDSDLIDTKMHAVWYWDAEHAFLAAGRAQKQHIKMEMGEKLLRGGELKNGDQLFSALSSHKDFVQWLDKEWQEKYYPVLSDKEFYAKYEREYPAALQIDDICYGTSYPEKVQKVKAVLEKRVPFMNSVYGEK